jgi:predicted transcriptional regulator
MRSLSDRSDILTISGILIAISILWILGSAGGLSRFGAEVERDPYEEFGFEVLLNRDDIEYDISLLDEYVDEGYISFMEVQLPGIIEEESIPQEGDQVIEEDPGFPPGEYYYYGSHQDPEIAVVITEVDDSMKADPFIPGIDLEGLSLSFVPPTKMVTDQEQVLRSSLELSTPLEVNDSTTFFIENMGYFTHPLFAEDFERVGVAMINGSVTIQLFNATSNDTLWSGLDSGIAVTVSDEDDRSQVDADIRSLLNEMGFNSSHWLGDYNEDTIDIEILAPDIDGVIEWREMVSTELEWLQGNGFIDGLNKEDINSISDLSGPGASGINHRVVYHEGEWKTFDEIGEIPSLGGSFEFTSKETRFKLKKEPFPVPPDREATSEFPLLMLIIIITTIIIVVLLIAGSFGYARHKRNELLNNLNRKHLFELITAKPGIHFSEIQRKLDLKQGVLSYHLNVLEKNEFIKSIQDGTYRRFYLYDDKIELEFHLHEMQEKILMVINQRPGITQSKISKALGRNRMVINYHLKILLETGILHVEREGRETHCYINDPNFIMASA